MTDDLPWDDRLEAERRRVEDAISEAVRNLRGGIVTKFIAIFEYVDDDGDRDVATMSTDALMRWDVNGMIDYIREGASNDRLIATINTDDD